MSEIVNMILSGVGLIAFTFFMLDRKTIVGRLNSHALKIDQLATQVTKNESELSANKEADVLRTQLLNKTLEHLEKALEEIKHNFRQQQQETKDLQKLIYDHLLGLKK